MPLHEGSGNDFLLSWIKDQCKQSDKLVFKGDTFPSEEYFSFHSNSKRDFFLYEKERNHAIVVNRVYETDDSMDEETGEDESVMKLIGIAGECKLGNRREKIDQ